MLCRPQVKQFIVHSSHILPIRRQLKHIENMSLDGLPFDALCHVFGYMSIYDLQAISTFGHQYEEAADWVARRTCTTYTLNVVDFPRSCVPTGQQRLTPPSPPAVFGQLYAHHYGHRQADRRSLWHDRHRRQADHQRSDTASTQSLRRFCQFLAKCVRTLTVEMDHSDVAVDAASRTIVIDLIASAERLCDLTLFGRMDDWRFRANLLARVQRLTLCGVSFSDHFVTGLLRTCSPDRLTELTVQSMRLTGQCLLAAAGTGLHTLRVCDSIRFTSALLHRLFVQLPGLRHLEIGDTFCHSAVLVPALFGHLRRLHELRLHTAGFSGFAALLQLDELRRLHITVDDQLHEDDLLEMERAAGPPDPTHPLRHLCVRSTGARFTERMGRALRHFGGLRTLELFVGEQVTGVPELLRGWSRTPGLRGTVRLVGLDGQIVVPAATVCEHLQGVESLQLVAKVDGELAQLVRMPQLRTLTLGLRSEGFVHICPCWNRKTIVTINQIHLFFDIRTFEHGLQLSVNNIHQFIC